MEQQLKDQHDEMMNQLQAISRRWAHDQLLCIMRGGVKTIMARKFRSARMFGKMPGGTADAHFQCPRCGNWCAVNRCCGTGILLRNVWMWFYDLLGNLGRSGGLLAERGTLNRRGIKKRMMGDFILQRDIYSQKTTMGSLPQDGLHLCYTFRASEK